MQFSKKLVIATCAAILAGMVVGTAEAGKGDIKYRQALMKAVGGHMGAMKSILKGEGGKKESLAGHAAAMAGLARASMTAFPKDSSKMEGPTRALDAIWEKPGDFAKVSKSFIVEADKLAALAKKGDMKGAAKQIGALGKNACGACHKPFREKKK